MEPAQQVESDVMLLPEIAESVLAAAKSAGATAADAVVVKGRRLEVGVRCGRLEKISQAEEASLGLRVFVGSQSAVASTSDLRRENLQEFARAAYELARMVAADSYAGLPPLEQLAQDIPDLELYDPEVANVDPQRAQELALRAEASAMDTDSRIVNSEGAECTAHTSDVWYASTAGFSAGYQDSAISVSVVPVGRDSAGMQRDYWYSSARHLALLEPPERIGRTAAERTLRRLNARPVRTCEVPVVFDPETAASLLRHLASAVVGQSIYRGASFLAGRLGDVIAPHFVTVVDDGRLLRGLGSKPFDAEGVATRRTMVVDSGVLRSYLLDAYSARRLGLQSTGNASRSVGSNPFASPTNFVLQAGTTSPEEIVRSLKQGLYVTELIGFGVNLTSGDYSRGAAGLWIENGEFAFPVQEVTVAGNLLEMFASIEAVGSDLVCRRSIASPTVLIGRLTVAGRG